jgi:hypothetical protein
MKKVFLTVLVIFGSTFVVPAASVFAQSNTNTVAAPPATESSTQRTCFRFDNRQYEVCSAYVFNASLGARLPYYKFGSSDNAARRTAALNRLESRYRSTALTYLTLQVRSWPTSVDVSVPRISIKSVSVSADQNRAVLRTQETWNVKTEAGRYLFSENSQMHIIRMQRVPGLVLHKWVVTSIQ